MMMRQTDELLASELSRLSVQERAEALDDVHCVGEELKETPEMMEKALADFAVAVVVLLIKEGGKYEVYETALKQNRAYVENDSFRLKFLRANFYDVDKSVRQMMRFLQMKATYFGIDKVARDITLDDLSEKDMEVLLCGHWHIQEERDRSGRVIVHIFSNMNFKAENAIRASYILWMNIMTSDLAVQTKGMVNIVHNVARTGQKIVAMPGLDFMLTVGEAHSSFPIRCSTMHWCLHQQAGGESGSHFYSFLRGALQILPLYETVRSRIHVGHSVEILYQLPTHGIPLESFPLDMNGKVRENIFFAWFDKYQRAERNERDCKATLDAVVGDEIRHSSSRIPQRVAMGTSQHPNNNILPNIVQGKNESAPEPLVMAQSATPSENDVLLGRGRFAQSWPGNVKFREFIAKQRDEYDRLSRKERQIRTIELTEALLAKGIRFYDQDARSGDWVEADRNEIRNKVSQMFRTLRKLKPNMG